MPSRKTLKINELAEFRRQNSWIIWAIVLFSSFVNVLMLTSSWYMLQVYERVLGSRSEETLLALTVLVAFLFATMGVLDFARARVGARYGARLQQQFDERVFKAAMNHAQRTGQTQSALSELTAVQRLTASPAFMALFDLPFTPLFIVVIFAFHPLLGFFSLGALATLIAVTLLNRSLTRRPTAEAAGISSQAEGLAKEMQVEAEVIRSLGMRASVFDRWNKARRSALHASMNAADLSSSFSTATKTLRLFMQSAILGLAAYLVLQNELMAGAMIAGSVLMGRALAPIDTTIAQWSVIADAVRGWNNLTELLQEEPEEPPRLLLPRPKASLEVSRLTVVPPGSKKPSLRGVSFRVAPGEAVGVIGPSGCGKSTLARALTGVWPPSGGSIRIDGVTLEQFDPDVLGRLIGYLPQSVHLLDGTVADNIARLDPNPDGTAVVSAARAAAADEMIRHLPEGYDTKVVGLGPRMSGGQVQRVGLARALYGDPVLLVLDEPNSALDADGSDALNRAILGMKERGMSVLIMAHRPNAIQHCDKLLVLKDGMVQSFGPRDEILSKMVKNSLNVKSVADAKVSGGLS